MSLPRHSGIQWNLSIEDTTGTQLAVLFREVSLIQRQICTHLYVVGIADSVFIEEVSFIQSFLYREVLLYRVMFPERCPLWDCYLSLQNFVTYMHTRCSGGCIATPCCAAGCYKNTSCSPGYHGNMYLVYCWLPRTYHGIVIVAMVYWRVPTNAFQAGYPPSH